MRLPWSLRSLALLVAHATCASCTSICPSPGTLSPSGTVTVPAGYADSLDCTATLSVASGIVVATITAFSTERNYDFLSFYDGATVASPLLSMYSGSYGVPLCVISTGTTLTVRFQSDVGSSGTGVTLSFTSSTDPGYYTMGPVADNYSPLFAALTASSSTQKLADRYSSCSANYVENTVTGRLITAPAGQRVLLTLANFASEGSSDFLYIGDGTIENYVMLATVDGTLADTSVPQLPLCFASGSTSMYLVWETDGNTNAAGWTANFQAVSLAYELICSVNTVLNATSGVLRDRYQGGCHGLYYTHQWDSCYRSIVAPTSSWRVRVTFTEFQTDSEQHLSIDNGRHRISKQMPYPLDLPYCFVSSTPKLDLEYSTNPSVATQSTGWQLQWDLVSAPAYELACVADSLQDVPITATTGTMRDRYTTPCSPVYLPTWSWCQRQMQAPSGKLLLIQFTQFEVYAGGVSFGDPSAPWRIGVSGNASLSAPADWFQGLKSLQSCFAASTNLTVVWEKWDAPVSGPGWAFTWSVVTKPKYDVICDSGDVPLTSPGSLRSHYTDVGACSAIYPAFRNCLRTINAPHGQTVMVTAVQLDAPGTDLRIFDSSVTLDTNGNYPGTGIILGDSQTAPACVFLSSSRTVTVAWDAYSWASSYFNSGWNISWTFVPVQAVGLFCGGTTQTITASSGSIRDKTEASFCQRDFMPNMECGTTFVAPAGFIIRFTLTYFVPNDWGDNLKLFDASMQTQFAELVTFFPNSDTICLQTEVPSAHLRYHTSSYDQDAARQKGWVANWTFVPNTTLISDYAIDFCSSTAPITTGPGYINSQGTSRACLGAYGNDIFCERAISAPLRGIVNITILQLSTETDWDFLSVYDGPSSSAPQIYHKSGVVNTSINLVSTGTDLYIVFSSDGGWSGTGWQAYYHFVIPTVTPSPTPTRTPSLTRTLTPTPSTPTGSRTPTRLTTLTPSPTYSATRTRTRSRSVTLSTTATLTPGAAVAATKTTTLSGTFSRSPSKTATASASLTRTATLSHSFSPTRSSTRSRSPTPTPSFTFSPTVTHSPSKTPTDTPSTTGSHTGGTSTPTQTDTQRRGRPWQLERCEDENLLAEGQTCWCWENQVIDCRLHYFEPWVDETNPTTLAEWNFLRRRLQN
eukprot:TRINITY_DN13973_c0_g1_i1.p1 TRINITY_DN13973_c0_g1~~TRINITY_DN13973_c0_g1_i1.p1  ORF type:complete len:1144 (+),score=74.88 TRINITY_DN13973_c0_g1_i1:122-3553(+)